MNTNRLLYYLTVYVINVDSFNTTNSFKSTQGQTVLIPNLDDDFNKLTHVTNKDSDTIGNKPLVVHQYTCNVFNEESPKKFFNESKNKFNNIENDNVEPIIKFIRSKLDNDFYLELDEIIEN